jgi:hypothetical protein
MVRAIASEENKKLGLNFARAVTVEAPDGCSLIMRCGFPLTLFSGFKECCASAVRNDDPFVGRQGMTELEFHKMLEKNGFTKLRDRCSAKDGSTKLPDDKPASERDEDPQQNGSQGASAPAVDTGLPKGKLSAALPCLVAEWASPWRHRHCESEIKKAYTSWLRQCGTSTATGGGEIPTTNRT